MSKQEKILILGACENANQIGYIASKYFTNKGYEVYPVNQKAGRIDSIQIHDQSERINNADTVTIFLNSKRQKPYYDYILSLNPKRIIFNPGTENEELAQLAFNRKIQVVSGCTIALFSSSFL